MGNPPQECIRVGVWSGPRNISTALMRSWSSRADCSVSDEPLYAHYLRSLDDERRRQHPAWEETIASQPTDPARLAADLTGPVPGGRAVWYQKHMAHHLTPAMNSVGDWVGDLTNIFLIRDPAEMITSFIKVIDDPTPEDLGLPQQAELFDRLRASGRTPAVFDARDILGDPARGLDAMCEVAGVAFDPAMLSWNTGPHPADGVWAPHWYASVYASTEFGSYRPKGEAVPGRLQGVLDECRGLYDHLAAHRAMA